jgi:hypothetical protein
VAIDREIIRGAWDGERLSQLALRPAMRARRPSRTLVAVPAVAGATGKPHAPPRMPDEESSS